VLWRVLVQRSLLGFRLNAVFVGLGIFLLATGASAFSAFSLAFWFNEWLKWVQVALIALLVLDMTRQRGIAYVAFALVAAGTANAVVGIYEFFGGSGAEHLIVEQIRFRAFGTFGQPNPFGAFMGMIAPVALGMTAGCAHVAWKRWRAQQRSGLWWAAAVGYLAAAGVMGAALYMSYSRGAWLGFAAALGVMAFSLPRKVQHGLAISALGLLLIGGLYAAGLLPQGFTARVASAFSETFNITDVRGVDIDPANYALVERLAHWQAAINMATDHPWLGVGFGNYEVAYPQYRLINWKFALGHAHNYYLNILGEGGIVGLVGYATMWLLVVGATWRARRHPDPLARGLAIGGLGTWTYIAAHSLTDNLYVNNLFIHIGVLFGTVSVLYNQTWPSVCKRIS
jgi:O-antigen ligase